MSKRRITEKHHSRKLEKKAEEACPPELIKLRSEMIQKTWTKAEEERRRAMPPCPWLAPFVDLVPQRYEEIDDE